MAMMKCSRGHIYDSSLGYCPVCNREAGSFSAANDVGATMPGTVGGPDSIGPTMPGNMGAFAPDNIGPTMPTDDAYGHTMGSPAAGAYSFDGGVGRTEPATDPGFTEMFGGRKSSAGAEDYGPTMPDPINGVTGFDPIVGWLVCVKGPNRGKDYRLHSGTNFIGRSPEMDVCIQNDDAISKRNAASISYDDRTRSFFIQKGEVRNLLYLNGKPVRSDADLVKYDRIEIGSTELLFVPLCGEGFSWQEI